MKNSAPIGIFDSGVGGLTVMRKLIQEMPDENVVYFGDTARIPYGNKSQETILHYTRQIIRFLETKKVKAIVIACNTASSYALSIVEKESAVPVIGVIEPGAAAAAALTRNQRVGIIGTYATIGSRAYEKTLLKINPDLQIFTQPCPLFVPFVEEGLTEDVLTDEIIARYLHDIKQDGIDTLLLGCTHYPLLEKSIEKFMGEGVTCVDPAANTARLLHERLAALGQLNQPTPTHSPSYTFYVSDSATRMTELANRIMPFTIENIQKINIEIY